MQLVAGVDADGDEDFAAEMAAARKRAHPRCAPVGLKTALIEKDGFLGGTCLHVG